MQNKTKTTEYYKKRLIGLYCIQFFWVLGFIMSIGGIIYYCIMLQPDFIDVVEGVISLSIFGYLSFKNHHKINIVKKKMIA